MSDKLNVKEAAKLLNTTEYAIYNKVRRNEIPYEKVGGRLMFSRKELKAMEQIKSAELIKDELVKGFIAQSPALSAFIRFGEMLNMFEQIAPNFSQVTQEAYINFITKYSNEVAQFVARDYKKSNINEN